MVCGMKSVDQTIHRMKGNKGTGATAYSQKDGIIVIPSVDSANNINNNAVAVSVNSGLYSFN